MSDRFQLTTYLTPTVTCPCGQAVWFPARSKLTIPCPKCGSPVATAEASAAERKPSGIGKKVEGESGTRRRPKVAAPSEEKPPAPSPPALPAHLAGKKVLITIQRQHGISLPRRCCCCMGPADSNQRVQHMRQVGNVQQTLWFDVPWCKKCDWHVNVNTARVLLITMLSLSSSFGIFWVLDNAEGWMMGLAFILFGGLVCTPASMGFGYLLLPRTPLGSAHGDEGMTASITNFDDYEVTFEFGNPAYGTLVATQNSSARMEARDRSTFGEFITGTPEEAAGNFMERRWRAFLAFVIGSAVWYVIVM